MFDKAIRNIQEIILTTTFTFLLLSSSAQSFIHIDQFGYRPEAAKVAVISNPTVGYNNNTSYQAGNTFHVKEATSNATVFTGAPTTWSNGNTHDQSGDKGWWFDFSAWTQEGSYYIEDESTGERSAIFEISSDPYNEVIQAAGRMFYYNRCGIEKPANFAGAKWQDASSFAQDQNTRSILDQGNASLEKDMSGGWFDAGDYNKYVTFTHSTLHDLLSAYEGNPTIFTDNWNIPESGNNIPDLLDEIKWELDWLFKMTNADGTVHIKMGSRNYSENTQSPPSLNNETRFYGPVCSAASISVASIMAHAAITITDINEWTAYRQQLISTAQTTFAVGRAAFNNNNLDTTCDDGSIVAGDADVAADAQLERLIVAAIYLFDLTGDPTYNDFVIANYAQTEPLQTTFWSPYKMPLNTALFYYTSLPNANTTVSNAILDNARGAVSGNYEGFFGVSNEDLYRAYMPDYSYHWGSNSAKASYGNLNRLMADYNLGNQASLMQKAEEQLHYFHGINPLDIVYLTNMYDFGAERSINEMYHGWFDHNTPYDHALNSPNGPAPGYVVGGPNSQFSVGSLTPPSGQPLMKSYLDFNDGYPLNSWEISEPAIYYQAAYLRLLSTFSVASNQNQNSCADNALTLELTFDDYAVETSWEITKGASEVVASGDNYNQASGEVLEIPICLTDACYTLTVRDAESDGMCCAYSQGGYVLKEGNNVLTSGGEFTDEVSFTFCLGEATNAPAEGAWKTLKTGAGGWITGLDIHPSGELMYGYSDVGGAYRYNPDEKNWTQVVTTASIPSQDIDWDEYEGVQAIVSAPSNIDVAYMAYSNDIYKSTDRADSWTATAFPNIETPPNNNESKLAGTRLAVDPMNENVVYYGSVNDGLYITTNGNNWSKVNGIPNGTPERGIRTILFDPSGGNANGRTNNIFIIIDGAGVYKSTDGGNSFQNLSFNSFLNYDKPEIQDAEVDASGVLYIVGHDFEDFGDNDGSNDITESFGLLQHKDGAWRQIFDDGFTQGEIAIDPFDNNRVMIFSYGFQDTYRTNNALANDPSWTFMAYDIESPNIPWIGWLDNDWFTLGEIKFDPVVADRIWISHGVGTFYADNLNGNTYTWIEEAVDQEHLVSNDVVAFSNGNVLTAHWDFPLFLHKDLDAYPEVMKPTNRFNAAWDIDQSPTDENFVVAIVEDERFCCFGDGQARSSSYSEDGGETWTRFGSYPGEENEMFFGFIAVSAQDNDNMIWLPSGNRMPYYTLDKGDTWTESVLPGASDACCLDAYYFKRRALVADRVAPNTFYLYDWGGGHIFKTSNGGQSWIKYSEVLTTFAYNGKLLSVPGKEGHLLFVNGPEQDRSAIEGLSISEDGGQTWSEFGATDKILNVAVGKAAPGQDYPTIFIAGKVNNVLGYYMSVDKGDTWTSLGAYPLGIYEWPSVMEGDNNIHGRLYVGFGGNGFVYHTLDQTSSTEAPHLLAAPQSLELVPNPAIDYFKIKGEFDNYQIQIVDVSGNVVQNLSNVATEHRIDISDLGPGMYFVRMQHLQNQTLFVELLIKPE